MGFFPYYGSVNKRGLHNKPIVFGTSAELTATAVKCHLLQEVVEKKLSKEDPGYCLHYKTRIHTLQSKCEISFNKYLSLKSYPQKTERHQGKKFDTDVRRLKKAHSTIQRL